MAFFSLSRFSFLACMVVVVVLFYNIQHTALVVMWYINVVVFHGILVMGAGIGAGQHVLEHTEAEGMEFK